MHNREFEGLCVAVADAVCALDVLVMSVLARRDLQMAIRFAKRMRGMK